MVISIIQARMASTRLPGKVLVELCGKPLLSHIIERVKQSRFIDKIVIATTQNLEDDRIEELGRQIGIDVFRGSENDVLDRFYMCAKKFSSNVILRVTADDPFKDPSVNDRAIQIILSDATLDYVSNTLKPTYPEGIDVEVFRFRALEKAWREAKRPSEREHVTPYIWNNPKIFSLYNFENDTDLSDMRWTLDTEADLKFIREVYNKLYTSTDIFLMKDILRLLEKEPWLQKINSGIERNAKYKKSILEEDNNETHSR